MELGGWLGRINLYCKHIMQLFLSYLREVPLIKRQPTADEISEDWVLLDQQPALIRSPLQDLVMRHCQDLWAVPGFNGLHLVVAYVALPWVVLTVDAVRSEEVKRVVQAIEKELIVNVLSFQGEFILRIILVRHERGRLHKQLSYFDSLGNLDIELGVDDGLLVGNFHADGVGRGGVEDMEVVKALNWCESKWQVQPINKLLQIFILYRVNQDIEVFLRGEQRCVNSRW